MSAFCFTGVRTLARLAVLTLSTGAIGQETAPELRKAPPDSPSRAYGERLSTVVEARYPELLTKKPAGVPVVTVLFNYDGTVAGTHLDFAAKGTAELTASETQFARFGLPAGRMQYIGVGHVQLHNTPAVVIFGLGDTRDLDRALVERFFPQVLTQRSPPNDRLWILFDHDGRVLRTGEETLGPEKLRKALEVRFSGIHTADMTTSAVFAQDGRALQDAGHHRLELDCLWLTADSPSPRP